MRVTYHVYYLHDKVEDKLYKFGNKFDIKRVLDSLIREKIEVKRGFLLDDEFLYLVKEEPKIAPDTFFFIITRDSELIKSIDKELSVQDIRKKLDTDNEEQIGIGSFVYTALMNNHPILAFSTQLLSPKINLFWNFINEYLKKKGLDKRYEIIGHPVMAKAEVDELMRMDVVGKTSMVVGTKHGRVYAFNEFLGKQMKLDNIDNFEITITPKRGKSIKDAMPDLSAIAKDPDTVKLTAKAKGEAYATLTELYIVGSGTLGNDINPTERTSVKVRDAIGTKMRDNISLGKKVAEFYSGVEFSNINSKTDLPEEFKESFAEVKKDEKNDTGGES